MKNPKLPTWRIDLTEEQFNCLVRGMEFYSRILAGQLEELDCLCPQRSISNATLAQLKREMFPELRLNESYPWHGMEDTHSKYYNKWYDHEIAQSYQIYRECHHIKAISDSNDGWNVYKSPTPATHKAQPPKITKL